MSSIINALRNALDSDPGNWTNRLALIEAFLNEGQQPEAVAVLNEVEALPEDAGSLLAAARAYALVGSEEAGNLVSAVLQVSPSHAQAHMTMAFVAHRAGNSALATESFAKARGLDPSISDAELDSIYGGAEATPEPVVAQIIEEEDDAEVEEAVVAAVVPEPDIVPFSSAPSAAVPEPSPTVSAGPSEAPKIVPPVKIEDPEANAAAENLKAYEHAQKLAVERARSRDKINSLFITIVAHIGVVILLGLVVMAVPIAEPPKIQAVAAPSAEETMLEPDKVVKVVPRSPAAASNAMPDVLAAFNTSDVAVPTMKLDSTQPPADFGMYMGPPMSFGMSAATGGDAMIFGMKVEGDKLGVILDVSGSMAEYLPLVIREVDRNFDNAPIVYINNALVRPGGRESLVQPVIAEDVVPSRDGRATPYWFLWGDLPRKAPQRSVDRLINVFKTRPNTFLAVGGHNRFTAAMDHLISQKIDALYVFSDFEDFVDEEIATEYGQLLGRNKVKTYVQPAEQKTEYLGVVTNKIANRSKGRQMPSLVAMLSKLNGNEPSEDTPPSLPMTPIAEGAVNYATGRSERETAGVYGFRPNSRWEKKQIAVLEQPNYDVVFYGPEARAQIFMKTSEGYIQYPITFGYHSWKKDPDPKALHEYRWRKFLRVREEPKLVDGEISWKMVLEDEIEFDVTLELESKGMRATYTAEPPPNGENDSAFVYFNVPPVAKESKDTYYGYDYPDGLTLDQIRRVVSVNNAMFNLSSAVKDRYESSWNTIGFKSGQNERTFGELVRQLPSGIRDVKVWGPSFGPRIFHARTTSNKVHLSGRLHRADSELWEGFQCRLVRPRETRTRITKTESISIMIE